MPNSPIEDWIAPLDVHGRSFWELATGSGLEIPKATSAQAAEGIDQAAEFLLGLLVSDHCRRNFPRALGEGIHGAFHQWLRTEGSECHQISARALENIRQAFAQPPGHRVIDLYLSDPALQQLYPFALLPAGQLHFFSWLTTHGRRDQRLRNDEILWFVFETAEDQTTALAITYRLQPSLQRMFPLALTNSHWREFSDAARRWLVHAEPLPATAIPPPLLNAADQRSVNKNLALSSGADAKLEGVNLLSHFCNASGIQQAALWTKAALERVGLRTSCRDIPVPRREIPTNRAEWLGLEIFPITILNQAATPYFQNGYERAGLYRRENVYRIAYWNWELEKVPDEWLEAAPLIDEIWSPTPFVATAMRARMPVPVTEMLPGVEVGPIEPVTRESLGIPQTDLVFLFMFDFHSQMHRKNPLAVVRAFEKAFRDDDSVRLVIKTSGGDIFPDDLAILRAAANGKRMIVLQQLMSRSAAYGMLAMCDCFVSLHRSEGFGLGLAEAMLLGKPVIATGYSGNLAFMDRENSLLVDYKIVEISEDRILYTKGNFWAEPDIDQAASFMRNVYENRGEARERAERARVQVAQKLSLESAGRRMKKRLEEIIAR